MGAYSSTPDTRKVSEDETFGTVSYGVSEMQGWRKSMEDVSIAARLGCGGEETLVFGVFDGHGGREVAHFCKRHFADALPFLEHWPSRRFEPLLREAFLKMDEMLQDAAHQPELIGLRAVPAPTAERSGRIEQVLRKLSCTAEGGSAPVDAAHMLRTVLERAGQDVEGAPAAEPLSGSGSGSGRGSSSISEPPCPAQPAQPADASRTVLAGCTAIVACLHQGILHVANAGDSRGVLCRGGRAVALSDDHKPQNAAEYDRIVKAGGWVSDAGRVNGNLNLSRSIGDLRYKRNPALPPDEQVITAAPDVRSIPLSPGEDEFFVLACDGIWDCKSCEQVVAFVRARLGHSPSGEGAGGRPALLSAIVAELFDECVSHNPTETAGIGGDNMTAMIVDLRHHCAAAGAR
ncbi:phosphatase 2C-like domain-containing protein [Pavlovales sp. CCMP2436]|nr:phosphatase 2C-like domain-containing protein [Pavlovales sp. CCMP2436]